MWHLKMNGGLQLFRVTHHHVTVMRQWNQVQWLTSVWLCKSCYYAVVRCFFPLVLFLCNWLVRCCVCVYRCCRLRFFDHNFFSHFLKIALTIDFKWYFLRFPYIHSFVLSGRVCLCVKRFWLLSFGTLKSHSVLFFSSSKLFSTFVSTLTRTQTHRQRETHGENNE